MKRERKEPVGRLGKLDRLELAARTSRGREQLGSRQGGTLYSHRLAELSEYHTEKGQDNPCVSQYQYLAMIQGLTGGGSSHLGQLTAKLQLTYILRDSNVHANQETASGTDPACPSESWPYVALRRMHTSFSSSSELSERRARMSSLVCGGLFIVINIAAIRDEQAARGWHSTAHSRSLPRTANNRRKGRHAVESRHV